MTKRLDQVRQRIDRSSPEGLLVAGFGGLIAVGTVLLALPWSQHGGVDVLDALFTSTSAVCVTGLGVVDTGTAYTTFGQIVILILIQMGGIGVMSFAALAFRLLGKRLSLTAQAAFTSSMLQQNMATELWTTFQRILRFVLIVEALGALVLFAGMVSHRGVAHAAYSSVFHSVSAFCNAGFSIYSDSLTCWRDSPLVTGGVMALIFLGGIGHPVVVDLWRALFRRRGGDQDTRFRLELSSRIALNTSVALILVGLALLLLLGLTPSESGWGSRVWNALFQSVTARTAGFNTVDIGALPLASLWLLVILMFVGGSPGSCAGGIKTTTFALWLAKLWHRLRGDRAIRLHGRYIPGEITRRVSTIIGLALVWNLLGLLLLLATEAHHSGAGMHEVLFEQVSAFGTVGLSTGLTPRLSVPGKLWIIATMFVGRLGPLTLAVWALTRRAPDVRYPEGRIMIG